MLKDAFYDSLKYELIVGLCFIFSMRFFGKRNCAEIPLEKHIALKICASILFVIGIIYGVLAYRFSLSIEYPNESLYHRTPGQTLVFNSINGAVLFIGLGAHLWFFRKSGTTRLQKNLKVLGYSTLFVLFPMISDFYNISFIVFMSSVVIVILCFLMDWKGTMRKDIKVEEDSIENENDNKEIVDDEKEICSTDVEL